MAGETNSQAQAIGEIISWLEQQLRQVRDDQTRSLQTVDQLRRQVYDLQEQITNNERSIREVDPKLVPFKGLPEKIRALDESSEHIRQAVAQQSRRHRKRPSHHAVRGGI